MRFKIAILLVLFICSCKSNFKSYNSMYVMDVEQDFSIPNKFNVSNQYFHQDSLHYYLVSVLRPGSDYQEYIEIKCLDNFAFFTGLNDYSQSVISYKFFSMEFEKHDGMEATGLIDNPKNLWFHPPRSNQYKPLQFCPYPYLDFPLSVDKEWTWNLTIGQNWEYEGQFEKAGLKRIHNTCDYSVVSKSKEGKHTIYKIVGNCESEIGNTNLTIHFHTDQGIKEMVFLDMEGVVYTMQQVKHPQR